MAQSPEQLSYLDWELEIAAGAAGVYPVRVVRSPAGEAGASMQWPFPMAELHTRLLELENALLSSSVPRRRVNTSEESVVRQYGEQAFDALIAGDIRSNYVNSQQLAAAAGKGLRIKLRIEPPELASLPWEFLYDATEGDYVVLSRHTPLVRYPATPLPEQPLNVRPPLRILGMVASPQDQLPLDVAHEQERIATALKPLLDTGSVELHWLPGQGSDDLQAALLGGPWHVFHFVGHGGFSADADEGFIALVSPDGSTERLGARELGRLLNDHPSLRLALLNACEGARGSQRDTFSSIAAMLIRRGVPAVVAMQFEITDAAALEFARAFYRALAAGVPLEGTVAEARKAVARKLPNSLEWAVPVLYLRSAGGNLFDLGVAQPAGGNRFRPRLVFAALAAMLTIVLAVVLAANQQLLGGLLGSGRPIASPLPSSAALSSAEPSAAPSTQPSAAPSPVPGTPIEAGAQIAAQSAPFVSESARFGKGVITDVAWSPDGGSVAVATSIGIELLDPSSLVEQRFLAAPSINGVVFAPDGRTLAAASGDGGVHIYRVADGELLETMAGHRGAVMSVAFAPDGLTLASGGDDNTVRLWRVDGGEPLLLLQSHTNVVRAVAFSPDGKTLASGSEDYNVRLWSTADGQPLSAPLTSGSGVFDVAFAPDGRTLAATSFDGNARLWSVDGWSPAGELSHQGSGALGLAFAPDGATLATTAFDNVVRIWDVASGELRQSLRKHSVLVPSLAYAPDGARLLSGSWDGSVQLWQASDGLALESASGWNSRALAVAGSPNQPAAAVGYFDGSIRLLSTVDGEGLFELAAHSGAANGVGYVAQATLLATAGDEGIVRLWRLADKTLAGELQTGSGPVLALAIDNGSELAATVGQDGRARVWRLADGVEVRDYGNELSKATSVAFASDGNLAVGFVNGRIQLYDPTSDEPPRVLRGHSGGVTSLAYSPDGSVLASGADDNTFRLWDAATGAQQRLLTGHVDVVASVVWSADGSVLASGSDDDTVKLWRAEDGSVLTTLRGHTNSVHGLAFADRGAALVSASEDGTVRIWKVKPP